MLAWYTLDVATVVLGLGSHIEPGGWCEVLWCKEQGMDISWNTPGSDDAVETTGGGAMEDGLNVAVQRGEKMFSGFLVGSRDTSCHVMKDWNFGVGVARQESWDII